MIQVVPFRNCMNREYKNVDFRNIEFRNCDLSHTVFIDCDLSNCMFVKYVRAGHVQTSNHWMQSAMEKNTMATT